MQKGKNRFNEVLSERIVLFDGAMGTMLQLKGYGNTPDLANLDERSRKIVRQIHLEYLVAGADVILTDTFGASQLKLASSGNEKSIIKINKKAVRSAKEAIEIYKDETGSSRDIFIAGDIGPSGKLLKPFGDAGFEEIYDSFKAQVEPLLDSGVGLILIETMMDINESLAAIKAVRDTNTDIPIAATLTFNETGVTLMGNTAESVGEELISKGACLIGANCSVGSSNMLPIVKKFREANPGAKLLFKPNAGMPKIKDGKTYFDETAEVMAKNIKSYLEYGPSALGSCCGSTPEHTKLIHKVINGLI